MTILQLQGFKIIPLSLGKKRKNWSPRPLKCNE